MDESAGGRRTTGRISYVFTPPGGALAPGQKVTIGFEHEGSFPARHQQARRRH